MDGQIGLFILFSSLHNLNSSEQCCNCCCRVSILSDHTIKKNIIIIYNNTRNIKIYITKNILLKDKVAN